MSDLLNHNPKDSPDKNVEVKVKSVSREDAGFVDAAKTAMPTYDVNMRIDNHSRNAILALAKATGDKRTASEMVALMIEKYLSNLDSYTFSVYDDFLNVMETKDRLDYRSRHH